MERISAPNLGTSAPSGHAKRVWWYPTGPLAFLPIHAASPCEGEQPGLPELIISSYIPSIHSLVRASKSPSAPFRLLAVGQPETPGFIPLPGVIKEVQSIQKLCQDASPESLTTIIGEEATVYKVLSSLPGHTSLHFSCHADQDEEYPFHSAFFLQNGALKLSKLMDLDLSRVQFTFLSACLTSAGDVNLPDECIHLSAGMQFAGVRSVVGTMWTVYDRASAMATSRVYRHLLRNGIENADASEAAEALHKAVLWMKKNNVPVAYRVPFIHLGV
ncbi:CHAT domain-containing protein [Flammula alnicola]|nr:CHAT domain-containing protein [Flammula alnicola]